MSHVIDLMWLMKYFASIQDDHGLFDKNISPEPIQTRADKSEDNRGQTADLGQIFM